MSYTDEDPSACSRWIGPVDRGHRWRAELPSKIETHPVVQAACEEMARQANAESRGNGGWEPSDMVDEARWAAPAVLRAGQELWERKADQADTTTSRTLALYVADQFRALAAEIERGVL